MPELTPDLLAKPAAYSARVIAREYLANVSAQFDRFLTDGATGFHDLRVALRRLRTWIRAYQPVLDDTIRKKTRRGLRKLANATNAPRDTEVMLEWVEGRTDPAARERAGVRYFTDRLTREHDEADAEARERMKDKLPKLTSALTKELAAYRLRYDIEEPTDVPSMARVARDTMIAQADRLSRAIDRIESADDADAIHRVRIAAKRLRYVLETIPDATAAALVERLTALQDSLGICHDMHGLVNRIVRELGEVGAHDARITALRSFADEGDRSTGERPLLSKIRPGLTALAARARQTERDSYAAFQAAWMPVDVARTVKEVAALGDDLIERGTR